MSRFLVTDENPEGYKLEDILGAIRNEMFERATKIMDDKRPEAVAVMNNNIKILNHLAESIALAENSTMVLDKAFGQRDPAMPRIGKAWSECSRGSSGDAPGFCQRERADCRQKRDDREGVGHAAHGIGQK